MGSKRKHHVVARGSVAAAWLKSGKKQKRGTALEADLRDEDATKAEAKTERQDTDAEAEGRDTNAASSADSAAGSAGGSGRPVANAASSAGGSATKAGGNRYLAHAKEYAVHSMSRHLGRGKGYSSRGEGNRMFYEWQGDNYYGPHGGVWVLRGSVMVWEQIIPPTAEQAERTAAEQAERG